MDDKSRNAYIYFTGISKKKRKIKYLRYNVRLLPIIKDVGPEIEKKAHEAQLVFSYKTFAECKGDWGCGVGGAG